MSSVSVIIPCYNAERTIERCLESIFAQTYRNVHIVIVNDGSTDATLSVVHDTISRLRNREMRIEVVSQENRGANAARNRGFAECVTHNPPQPSLTLREGESSRVPPLRVRGGEEGLRTAHYALFCDADIVLRRDCLEKMVRALEEHPDVSYAYSSFKFGWKTFKLWPFDAERLHKMPYIHTTSLIRADHFPGWDESIKRLQDWDLWLTMLEQGHTGVWIPEVLFRVINTKGTMSTWLPSFAYNIPKWLGIQPKAVMLYNEAVARIKAKHNLK
ncbi:glycosyltransferase family 2 protein [Candidatus Uhrbacteria bacterium]|nr:glycosyltransferase family 2 protein [Candidatus Uhrbacteria bacterium]